MQKSEKYKVKKVGYFQWVFKMTHQTKQRILSPLCLPIPPHRRRLLIIAYFFQTVKAHPGESPGMHPENYIWSRFKVKGTRHSFKNQSISGSFMASRALRVCQAAESNSVLPAFCSSRHLM